MILLAAGSPARLSMAVVWETGLARWLMLAGLSVAAGGLTGRGLTRQYKGGFPVRLPGPWALRGSLLGAAASAWLALIALGGADFVAGLARLPRLFSATQGAVAGAEVAAFLLAAVLLRLRQPGWSWLPLTAVIAADAMRGLLGLYATAAAWLFATVVASCLIAALVLVPLGSLLTTTYGIVLIVKAAVAAVAAGFAVAGRVWLRRRPEPAAGPALATRLECATLAGALAVAGLLTALTPPAAPFRHSATAPALRHTRTHTPAHPRS